jgi:small subunit ribosomal protein S20
VLGVDLFLTSEAKCVIILGVVVFESRESEVMANIKSQKKRILTNEKAHKRNVAVKSELKTLIRKTREAVEAKNAEAAASSLKIASRKLDKAVSKGVIHKNQAANRKSALAKTVAGI